MSNVEKRDIFRFFEERLMPRILQINAPKALNIQDLFREFVETLPEPSTALSAETAELMMPEVIRLLELRLKKWESLAVPRPLGASGDSDPSVYITWKHGNYSDLTGYTTIPPEFCGFLSWIEGLDSKKFVLLSAAYLAALGADPIYITDQTRDCGIDCIGRISSGPLHSMAIFLQAKTSSGWLTSGAVAEEFGKYLTLVHSEKYPSYRRALRLDDHPDGCLPAYIITCNSEFKDAAIEFAKKVGFLLRPKSQLAWFLTSAFDFDKLVAWVDETNCHANLERNIMPELNHCVLNF